MYAGILTRLLQDKSLRESVMSVGVEFDLVD